MRTYHHLSLEEREKLFARKESRESLREIARRLGRSHSSLSRELKRHTKYGKNYLPCIADRRSTIWADRQRYRAPLKCPLVFLYLRKHLRKPYYWSPEQIAARLSIDYPEYSFNDETIYRYIYSQRSKTRGMKLWQHLTFHRKRRMKKHGRKVKAVRLPTALPIEMRPEAANTRCEAGHWETDNVGTVTTDKTGISATVERKSRVMRIRKLKDQKSQTKRKALVIQLKHENQTLRKTMTIDRGSENSQHEKFTKQTMMPVYACNSYHSWEKGSIENGIGRLKKFVPKKQSVDNLTQKDLTRIENIMNNTPRKCLGYLTPNEMLERILANPRT
ncbi:IS30 family transposase [Candidatus Parcubacteria bacterium]|nr:MAG: IS30 family transposase [Candidatus Parcubacteria bacterium]